jgi:hypothetical protein
VTFLFTDVVGSTSVWEADEAATQAALELHDRVLSEVLLEHGGYVFSRAGDSFAAAFGSARAGVQAAVASQRALGETGLAVRMGLHAGEAFERDGDFFGPTVNRAARVMAAAHGGQILLASAVAELLTGRFELRDLGKHRLRDVRSAVRLWQVEADGLPTVFPHVPSAAVDTYLPVQLTSLVGRDNQVAAVSEALVPPCVLTLTGVGGIGKTRLALQAGAAVLDRFADGVWLVELAVVDSPDVVAEVVLAGLGSGRHAQMTALASLAEFCAAHQLLVLLDNCEHVLEAAGRSPRRSSRRAPAVFWPPAGNPSAWKGKRCGRCRPWPMWTPRHSTWNGPTLGAPPWRTTSQPAA